MTKFGRKFLSAVTVFVFLTAQVASSFALSVDNLAAPASSDQSQHIQTITPAQALAKQNAPSASGQIVTPGVPNTFNFVSDQNTIRAEENKKEEDKKFEEKKDAFELERYTFEEAKDLVRPDYATAFIL